MIINLDNALQVIGLAVVILFALIGLIFISAVIVKMIQMSDKRFDDLDDYYEGCDMQKVEELRHGK